MTRTLTFAVTRTRTVVERGTLAVEVPDSLLASADANALARVAEDALARKGTVNVGCTGETAPAFGPPESTVTWSVVPTTEEPGGRPEATAGDPDRALGARAFAEGLVCTPARDARFMAALREPRAGVTTVQRLEAWHRGWTLANLAAPVPSDEAEAARG